MSANVVAKELKAAKQAERNSRGFSTAKAIRYVLLIFSSRSSSCRSTSLLITSFKTATDADPSTTWLLPTEWSMQNWINAWGSLKGGIWRSCSW